MRRNEWAAGQWGGRARLGYQSRVPPPEFLVRPLIARTVAITRFPPFASEAAVHERYRPGIEEEAEETLKLINS